MNKGELIESIAKKTDMSKAAAGAALDAVLDSICGSLKKGAPVRIVGFGTFGISKRKAGTARNPRTGEKIKVKASKNARFKAGAALKAMLN